MNRRPPISTLLPYTTLIRSPDKEASNVLIVTHGVTLKLAQLIFDNAPLGELVNYNVAHNAQVHHYQYKKGTFDRIR